MQLMICTKFVGDVAHYGEEFYIYRMPVKTSIPFTDGIFSISSQQRLPLDVVEDLYKADGDVA
jgi:hypothetical protein